MIKPAYTLRPHLEDLLGSIGRQLSSFLFTTHYTLFRTYAGGLKRSFASLGGEGRVSEDAPWKGEDIFWGQVGA